jgi:Holliday junction resolvase
MNSRSKGSRGERAWRDELRSAGWMARRGQQFSGSPDSPDVVCPELDCLHFEVKRTEALRIYPAIEQAIEDAGDRIPVVAHRRNRYPWLVVLRADDFLRMLNHVDLAALAGRAGLGEE